MGERAAPRFHSDFNDQLRFDIATLNPNKHSLVDFVRDARRNVLGAKDGLAVRHWSRLAAAAQYLLATEQFELGLYKEALRAATEGLDEAHRSAFRNLEARCIQRMGLIRQKQGCQEAAQRFFPRALESWLAMFQAAPELRELLRLLAANNPYP